MTETSLTLSKISALANPTRFLALAGKIIPWLAGLTFVCLSDRSIDEPSGPAAHATICCHVALLNTYVCMYVYDYMIYLLCMYVCIWME